MDTDRIVNRNILHRFAQELSRRGNQYICTTVNQCMHKSGAGQTGWMKGYHCRNRQVLQQHGGGPAAPGSGNPASSAGSVSLETPAAAGRGGAVSNCCASAYGDATAPSHAWHFGRPFVVDCFFSDLLCSRKKDI